MGLASKRPGAITYANHPTQKAPMCHKVYKYFSGCLKPCRHFEWTTTIDTSKIMGFLSMSLWQSWLGLLFWCPIFNSSHSNSHLQRGWKDFPTRQSTRILLRTVSPAMAINWHASLTWKPLEDFFKTSILFCNVIPFKCNNSAWN